MPMAHTEEVVQGGWMIETQNVTYRNAETELTGFLALDTNPGRRPEFLSFMEVQASTDHARGRALRLAEWGFVVFACDMYGKSVTGNREKVIQLITEFRGDRTRLCERAQAGVNVLKSHPLVDGRLGAVGYRCSLSRNDRPAICDCDSDVPPRTVCLKQAPEWR